MGVANLSSHESQGHGKPSSGLSANVGIVCRKCPCSFLSLNVYARETVPLTETAPIDMNEARLLVYLCTMTSPP